MTDKETREELVNIARIQFSLRRLSEDQKSRLIQIHDSYLRLLRLRLIKADEIMQDCKRIEDASRNYLREVRTPGQLSEAERKDFHFAKAYVKASVEAYRYLAKRCRDTYQGLGKRGRPAQWQKRIYIISLAGWYEQATGKKPRAGTDSVFPNFLRTCFHEIAPKDKISDSVIRSAMRRYDSTKRAEIKRAIEEEKRRAIIALRKRK
jgi:hypothetical protein